MRKVVIGIGNRLMRDDGIGVYIVESLAARDKTKMNQYIIGETDLDYCISKIEGEDYIILIDAMVLGKEHGNVSINSFEELTYPKHLVYSHDYHLLNLLKLRGSKGILIGIEPFLIDYNIGLSEPLSKSFNEILITIENIIAKI